MTMNARYLTGHPLDGYLSRRPSAGTAPRRDKFNLRPLLESVSWVLAGASFGSAAVILGAWGLTNLTEPRLVVPHVATAIKIESPIVLPQ
jgi:hypothetical protein